MMDKVQSSGLVLRCRWRPVRRRCKTLWSTGAAPMAALRQS